MELPSREYRGQHFPVPLFFASKIPKKTLRCRSQTQSSALFYAGLVMETFSSFNPFRLSHVYIYVRNSQTVATPVRIYTYTEFAIEIWGFNRRLTDTLRYHHTVHTRCSRASSLQLAAILQQVNQRKKSGVYSELSAVFGKFWKITIVGPSSIHR